MSTLSKQDILTLITQKEEQDEIFRHNEEVKTQETSAIFNKIKETFLSYAIEESIKRHYQLDENWFGYCMYKAVGERITLDFDWEVLLLNIYPSIPEIDRTSEKDIKKMLSFYMSYDDTLLCDNLSLHLTKNGFDKIGWRKFETTKSKLLGTTQQNIVQESSENDVNTKAVGMCSFIALMIVVFLFYWCASNT